MSSARSSVLTLSFLLQSWDTEFDDWVNVIDITELPHKCKLHVVMKGWHDLLLYQYFH